MTIDSTSDMSKWDVSDPALYQADIWQDAFARLRAEDPVHYCSDSPYGPYWSLTRYDHIMQVELDHATYSSSNEFGGIQVQDQPKGNELPNFLRMDPPRHTAQRKTVAPIVKPANLRNFEDLIRDRTCLILDALPIGQTVDWVADVSVPLTTMMLATLFDFPFEERQKLAYWTDVSVANPEDPNPIVASSEEKMAILEEMGKYFQELWRIRQQEAPKPDLISMLAHGDATRDMPWQEFIGNLRLLIVGGNDTTRNAMSGGILFMHENPTEWQKFRKDPSIISNLVAETIRYQSPVIHMRRTARQDCEIGGKQIKRGDKVIMWYVSGNLDEAAFDAADKFRIDRPNARRHLAFGAGIHRCVGDRLAEQQLRILWEEIHKRGLAFSVVGPVDRIYSNFIRGIRKMPVSIQHANK